MTLLATTVLAFASRLDAGNGQTWIHLIPAGQFAGRDGRGPWYVSDANAVVAASRQLAGHSQIPVDYEHQIDRAAKNGQPAPAAGWIKGMQARADGIWGLVDWTPKAAEHLARKEYRYLSPVFRHQPDGRVVSILRASLTNTPNLDQLTALASMETTMNPTNPADDGLADLRQLLQLPADASIGAITAKVRELMTTQQSVVPDPAQYVPIGDFERVTIELNRINQGVSLQNAQIAVEQEIGGGRMPPFLRDWGIALCSVNKPAFDAFISKTGTATRRLFEPSGARATPPDIGRGDLTGDDERVAAALGHSPDAMRARAGATRP